MNKDLTIVFSSYQSQHLLTKILKHLHRKFNIIVIENSLDREIKKSLEKKFSNTKVIIPEKNLGLAKSYNLGIKKSKTNYVFLNNPDIEIQSQSILQLLNCAKKIKKFGIISPTYKIEKIYKNYEIFFKRKSKYLKTNSKFKIKEVDHIDNNFLINKQNIKGTLFDENFFLYFETSDFAYNLRKRNKKLYVVDNIKFHHYGSSSVNYQFKNIVNKSRSFHYNWSKFYFYKKNFNYFYALSKIFPNLVKSLKKIILGLVLIKRNNSLHGFLELIGILTSLLYLKSFYRPKN